MSEDPTIHPTAVVHPKAELGENVVIGPHCVIEKGCVIGHDTVLMAGVVVHSETIIGRRNTIHAYAVLGGAPQDVAYRGQPTRLTIGDGNTIREFVTINKGTTKERGETIIGSDNLFMACCHVAHDCILGNEIIMANNVLLAGHVRVGDCANISGADFARSMLNQANLNDTIGIRTSFDGFRRVFERVFHSGSSEAFQFPG